MPAIGQNVTHWQGNSRLIKIPVKDDAGNAVDLSSALIVRWWMGRSVKAKGAAIYIQKSSLSGGGISLDEVSGVWIVTIALVPDDTEDVPPGDWYHECEVIDEAQDVATITTGTFTVNAVLIPNDLDVTP